MDPKDLKEIKAIIDLMKKHGLSVFEIEKEGFRLKLEKGPSVQAAAAMPPPVAAEPKAASSAPEAAPPGLKAIESVPLKEIVSPMVGTFYRAASPDGAPFVDVGKSVTEDTVVCIIEAMKVMNEIKADQRCKIVKILAENSRPVAAGQALFVIEAP